MPTQKVKGPPSSAGGSTISWASGYTGLSGISNQQSQFGEPVSDELMSSLLDALKEQKNQIATLSKKVAELSPEDASSQRCYYCRQLGHLAADCPKLKSKEEKAAAEKAAAAEKKGQN